MKTLDLQTIENHWDELLHLSDSKVSQFISEINSEQKSLLEYLLYTGDELLDKDDRAILLFMGLMTWYILRSEMIIPTLDSSVIQSKENLNIEMLEYLAGEPEAEFFDTVDKIMSKYKQTELLQFLIEKLYDTTELHNGYNKDSVGMIVIFLKTIIDSIEYSTETPELVSITH